MNKRFVVALSTIIVAGLAFPGTKAQAAMVCDLEILPSPIGIPLADPVSDADLNLSGDPCVDGATVFGPVRFARSNGQPEMAMANFDLVADADVCVISEASAKGKSFIYIDGVRIAEPEYFDDGFDEQVHSLVAGSHGLGVRVVGKPGEYVDIEIRQIADTTGGGGDPGLPAPGEVQIDPETGAVDMVSADGSVRLQNVASDHPLLTPNGDGDDDTTMFQALTTPLVPLPGKDDGTVNYFLDWAFEVVDLDTCASIDPGLSGSQQINSPTLVTVDWDGLDSNDIPLPGGTYAYRFDVMVVNESNVPFGGITSPAFGIVIDASTSAPDYDEQPEQLGPCNPDVDPSNCKCPGVDNEPGTPDPTCVFSFVTELLPELGLPPSTMPSYVDAEAVDKNFISTTYDPVLDRYTVVVDLRDYNAGGLVPKARGVWASEGDLRQWVSDMTGVPVGTGDSLFNFDYVQIGTTTGVTQIRPAFDSFNHFFLDAITDDFGVIRIPFGGATPPSGIDLHSRFNSDNLAPPQYVVSEPRAGDECAQSGNTDGTNGMRGKFCTYNTAFPISDISDLGVYGLRTTVFDIQYDETQSRQDAFCNVVEGITCGVRTYQVAADQLEIHSDYYIETATGPAFTRSKGLSVNGAVGLSFMADRELGEDGVCARSVATRDGLAVRMDSADGAVPDSCIINGIF